MKTRYRFNVVNKLEKEESWTGVFNNRKLADEWYNEHGVYFMALGYKFVLKTSQSFIN